MMSPELFRRIIAQAAPLTEQVCLHLMGDPLVHPKLGEILEACDEFKAPVYLVTNGVLMREMKAELLLHPRVRQVCFSLHSFADNFGDRDPTDYLEKIFRFTERAFVERPDLYINFRLWNLQSPVESPASPYHRENLDILARIEARFGVEVSRAPDIRRSKGVRLKNRLYMHFDTEFVWPSMNANVISTEGTCYGLSSHFGILVDGTVVPCCLDKEGMIPLGNGEHEAMTTILKSDRAQAIVTGFKNRQLIEPLCQRCQYVTRFRPKASRARSALNAPSPTKNNIPKIQAPTIAPR